MSRQGSSLFVVVIATTSALMLAGFDAAGVAHGTGLQGMADRLDAIGGDVRVRSAPGEGTTVTGTLPAECPRS